MWPTHRRRVTTNSQGFTHGQVAEINIIPLAAVMLVLLIIFMIATPALTRQIDLSLPGTDRDCKASIEPPESIRLRIDAAGQVYWDDSAMPLSALQAMMSAEVDRDGDKPPRLEIDANGDSHYQVLTTVLAAARNADLVRVGFIGK